MSIDDLPGHLDRAEGVNAVTLVRASAGDVRELRCNQTQFDEVVAELRVAEQALERAAALLEVAP
jgi:hypothetical protein